MAASIIDALVITLGLDTSDYDKQRGDVEEGMKNAREDASKTAKDMESQGKRASSFFSSIKTELLALAGVSLTVGGLTSFVKNTTNDLMNLSVQSKALNMSAQALDGWSRAAQAAGSSAESVTGTMTNLRNAALAFKNGDASSPLYKAMAMLNGDTGVTFDPNKDSTDVMMRKLSEALQKERNPDRAQYIGQMITGNDAALYQGLRSGELPSSATKYTNSSQISDQSLKASQEFTRVWTDLGQNFDNLKNELFTGLIPYIRQFNKYLLDLSRWVSQHPKEIHDAIETFFNAISEGAKAANKAADAVGGWKNALEILIGLKVASWVFGITKMFSGLFALTPPPWIAAAAAVGIGVKAVNNISDAVTKEDNTSSLWESIKQRWSAGGWYNNQKVNAQKRDTEKSPEEKRKDQDEKSYWNTTKEFLSKIASSLVAPASAAEVRPVIQSYQPNVPLNPEAAKLGPKGKALLDMMSGEFGQLEAKYGLPTGLLRSVAATESGGDPEAKSKVGAEGLFQFMPATAKDMGLQGREVNDPQKSSEAAAKYLSQLLSQTGGNLESALAAYNWGIGNVKKKGLENAPEETRNYVPKVLAGMRPGSGMAVDSNPTVTASAPSAPQYNINNVTVASPAQSVSRLATDIVSQANNRVRVLAFNSGQQ